MKSHRLLPAIALLGCAVFAAAKGPVEMSELPLFLGPSDVFLDTYRIGLVNGSDSYQNAIVTAPGGTAYPIRLAPHARGYVDLQKVPPGLPSEEITMRAWPLAGGGPTSEDRLWLSKPMHLYQTNYLVVGAQGENVQYLSDRNVNRVSASWCDYATAPTRTTAYAAFDAIFLSRVGAEHVSDLTVTALRGYALEGGVLVFPPGITDPRWKGMLAGVRIRRLGLGAALTLGFDACSLNAIQKQVWASRIAGRIASAKSPQTATSTEYRDPGEAVGPAPSQPGSADPFSVELPKFTEVVGLLLVYFVAVVPLNFFVLRKLRRPELTWITAPVLAIAFGGVLFSSVRSLYHAATSRTTHGTLLVQAGVPDAVFVGTSDIFEPHAGTVSLQLHDCDWIGTGRSGLYGEPAASSSLMFDVQALPGTVDLGTDVQVPAYEAHNLQFTEVTYAQRVKTPDWFQFEALPRDKIYFRYKVTNNSPYTIEHPTLYLGDILKTAPSLAPGQSIVGTTVRTPILEAKAASTPDSVASLIASERRIALLGTIEGIPVGPLIGNLVASRSEIRLAAFGPSEMELPVLYREAPENPPSRARQRRRHQSTTNPNSGRTAKQNP